MISINKNNILYNILLITYYLCSIFQLLRYPLKDDLEYKI